MSFSQGISLITNYFLINFTHLFSFKMFFSRLSPLGNEFVSYFKSMEKNKFKTYVRFKLKSLLRILSGVEYRKTWSNEKEYKKNKYKLRNEITINPHLTRFVRHAEKKIKFINSIFIGNINWITKNCIFAMPNWLRGLLKFLLTTTSRFSYKKLEQVRLFCLSFPVFFMRYAMTGKNADNNNHSQTCTFFSPVLDLFVIKSQISTQFLWQMLKLNELLLKFIGHFPSKLSENSSEKALLLEWFSINGVTLHCTEHLVPDTPVILVNKTKAKRMQNNKFR